MKKFALSLVALIVTASLMAQTGSRLETRKKAEITKGSSITKNTPPAQSGQTPDDVMKVNVMKHDFGKIQQGVPVNYSFELKNTSGKPLVVENTYASCGCTTPEKIVEPIAPGATAKLKVQYNAANVGPFTKDVHIKLAGVQQEKIVQITGEVVAAQSN